MVATRRGARVSSPNKTNSDESAGAQATPLTGRRTTRRTARQAETREEESSSQPEESQGGPVTSPLRRCTRAFRLHSPEPPTTPQGSAHEADVSDVESSCSALLDGKPAVAQSQGRRRRPPPWVEDGEGSDAESCSSVVSASKGEQGTRRSTRTRRTPARSCTSHSQSEMADQEDESCGSVVSDAKRVTRSQRRSTRVRTKQPRAEQVRLSDAESCTSGVSEATGRTSRSRRRTALLAQPIPMHLDEASESSQSSAPSGRKTRSVRGTAAASLIVSESQSCESEGFESGPSSPPQRTTRSRAKSTSTMPVDSDLELAELSFPPGSSRGRGTPCTSRTGSGNSSRSTPATRLSAKLPCVVLERTRAKEGDEEPGEKDLEGDMVEELTEGKSMMADADCTVLEEEKTLTLEDEDEENVTNIPLGPNDNTSEDAEMIEVGNRGTVTVSVADVVISETSSILSASAPQKSPDFHVTISGSGIGSNDHTVGTLALSEPAVAADDQQRETSAEDGDVCISEMVTMQETGPSVELPEPPQCHSVSVTVDHSAASREATEQGNDDDDDDDDDDEEEAMEVDSAGTHTDTQETVAGTSAHQLTGTSEPDARQDTLVESIQVTSTQEKKVSLDCGAEQQSKYTVVVKRTGSISLLDSSDDEEDEEEEEEEDSGHTEEERAGPSKKPTVAVDGLFVIDTRPGEEADEQYVQEKVGGQEEDDQEEPFVDEEGEDDDDEDARMLFFSRNPRSKELSSCIDPGLRVKDLGGLYINFDGSKSKPVSSSLKKLKQQKIQDEVMKKSVIGPEFEKHNAAPPYIEAKRKLKLKNKEVREQTTGDGWFNMKAPELTRELKTDLRVLQMRRSMDPKKFFKKNDREGLPKYFQIGTVVDNPMDFYHSRIPKKERKRTMVEELLADAEFRQNNKKKYQHIMAEKAAQAAGRFKKKKKFHKK